MEYYPREILSQKEAVINRKIFLFRVTVIGVNLTPNVSVILLPPTAINRIQFTTLDSIDSQTRHISFIAPVISNRPDKIFFRNKDIDEFSQISSKLLDGSISIDEGLII